VREHVIIKKEEDHVMWEALGQKGIDRILKVVLVSFLYFIS